MWYLPEGSTCLEQTQPTVANGTPCDDGTTIGVCVAGTCSESLSCDVAAAQATRTCVSDLNAASEACHVDGGAPCADDDPGILAALSTLDAAVTTSCSDGEFGSLTVSALASRLRTSCVSEAASLSSRSFGGPDGVAYANAGATQQACVQTAHQTATTLIDDVLTSTNSCLAQGNCDQAVLSADIQALASVAEQGIADACVALQDVIALTPAQYVERTLKQADCIAATSNADTGSLSLSCGPSAVDSIPTRGQYVQVILDGAEWDTKCGDGSSYAFQLRLAPPGQPLDRVLIGMQGGGVCVFGSDCDPRWQNSPGLFEALSDQPPGGGIMSTNPSVSDFANWTKVYLPYCTQDVFAGGGVTQFFTGYEIERYGAVNVRAAIEYVRNLLWLLIDQEGGDGYRPDQMTAAFGGWSAGGFGAIYNYHWMLDDLQWPHTTAFNDAGLALDSGDPLLSVRNLGGILGLLWGANATLPPYCFSGDCAVGPDLYMATAPRLKAVPNQQLLILSNQNDGTQISTTFFPSTQAWINSMRTSACETRDLNGIHYYLTSSTNSVHVVSLGSLWGQSVDGEVMADWFWNGVNVAPNSVVDRMEEGNFVQQFPGVNAFPCAVAP